MVDDLLDPDRLADAAGADLGRRLLELAPAEEPECLAVGREIAAEGVELVVPPRNELVDEGFVLGRIRPRWVDLGVSYARSLPPK